MRRSQRGQQQAFSLFPFLAVLLCTMGGLVVLLVAMAHVSRQKASRESVVAAEAAQQEAQRLAEQAALEAPERKEIEAALAEATEAETRFAILRDDARIRLEQEQQRLSDIEQHLARLRDEEERLMVKINELLATQEEHYGAHEDAVAELERLNTLIGQLEVELEELKHAASGRARRYAIVPLRDQTHGTVRPAAYFECTAQGVILQPEGIVLNQQDLIAPDVSSPVAAAVRTIRRHYLQNPEARAASEQGEPYPLLVVRPGGITNYYKARSALEFINADYGYQPVGKEWPMEFGAPDPELLLRLTEEIDLVRRERVELARLQPSRFRQKQPPRLARSGKAKGLRGSGGSGPTITVHQANPRANNPFDGIRFEGVEQVSQGKPRNPYEGLAPPTGGDLYANAGPALTGNPSSQPFNPAEENSKTGERGGVGGEQASQGAQGEQLSQIANQDSAQSRSASQPTSQQQAASGQAANEEAAQAALQGAAASAAGSVAPPQEAQEQAAAAAASLSSSEPPSAEYTLEQGSGSGSGGHRGIPIVRPIRLVVTRDHVLLMPDSDNNTPRFFQAGINTPRVDLPGPTVKSANEIITMLREHADTWGIAGEGLYWDPRVRLDPTNGGEKRAKELSELLNAAGLKLQKRASATATNPSGGNHAPRR